MFFNHSNSQSHSQGFSDIRTSGGPPANTKEVTNDKKDKNFDATHNNDTYDYDNDHQ